MGAFVYRMAIRLAVVVRVAKVLGNLDIVMAISGSLPYVTKPATVKKQVSILKFPHLVIWQPILEKKNFSSYNRVLKI